MKNDGTVVTWGGGSVTTNAPAELTKIKAIYSSTNAFAAIYDIDHCKSNYHKK